MSKQFAEDHNLKVGSPVKVTSSDGKEALLEVKGIYEPPPFYPILGAVSIPIDTFDRLYERPRNQYVFVNVSGDPEAAQGDLEQAVAEFPDASVQTREAWITKQDEDFNQFLVLLYVLLTLAVIISLFGMVNTLILTVLERTRSWACPRDRHDPAPDAPDDPPREHRDGADRGGLGLPPDLSRLVTQALGEFDVRFQVPTGQLIVFAVIAIIVGILAAIAPARRAAKLNVLRALQYE